MASNFVDSSKTPKKKIWPSPPTDVDLDHFILTNLIITIHSKQIALIEPTLALVDKILPCYDSY